jgi:hypothetical protein
MQKRLGIFVLFILVFGLIGCAANSNGIDKGLYNNTIPIIKIYHDFLNGNKTTDDDARKIRYYFDNHPDTKYKDNDLKLLHLMNDLSMKVEQYKMYNSGGDVELEKQSFDECVKIEKEVNDLMK